MIQALGPRTGLVRRRADWPHQTHRNLPGAQLNPRYQERKSEYVVVVQGNGYVEKHQHGHTPPPMFHHYKAQASAQLVMIPAGLIHRMRGHSRDHGGSGWVFLDLSHGSDSDIIRWQDGYGRAAPGRSSARMESAEDLS